MKFNLKKEKKNLVNFQSTQLNWKKKSNKKRKINDQGQPKLTYQTRVIRLG